MKTTKCMIQIVQFDSRIRVVVVRTSEFLSCTRLTKGTRSHIFVISLPFFDFFFLHLKNGTFKMKMKTH